eukprot:1902765-Amphidinium_carterae.1
MASMLDSEATFSARLNVLGLRDYQCKFDDKGINTIGSFGLSCSYTPGVTPTDSALISQIIEPILGAAEHRLAGKLRQLYIECHTLAVGTLRAQYEQPDDSKTKLPPLEREERLKAFRHKYAGLHWSDHVQPAYTVIDKFVSMREGAGLTYVPPEEIPTRDQEIDHLRKDPYLKADSSGTLSQHAGTKLPAARVGSDLRLRMAFTRRGVAMEVADLLTFTIHEQYVESIFAEFLREQEDGWANLTMTQLLTADRKGMKLLGETLGNNVGKDSSEVLGSAWQTQL